MKRGKRNNSYERGGQVELAKAMGNVAKKGDKEINEGRVEIKSIRKDIENYEKDISNFKRGIDERKNMINKKDSEINLKKKDMGVIYNTVQDAKKQQAKFAEGGIAYVNDDFPELVDNQTYVIDGFYGASNTPTEIYVMELSEGGKWYAVRDSQNINYTNDSFYDGIDVEGIQDLETITSSQPIQYSDDLEERMVSHYGDELEERGDDYYAKGGVPEKRYSFKYVIFNDEGERERGYGKGFGSSEQEAKNNLLTRVEEGLNEGEEVMDVEVIGYAKGGKVESVLRKSYNDIMANSKVGEHQEVLDCIGNEIEKVSYAKGGKIADLKKGDFVQKKGSNIALEVISVEKDKYSDYDVVELYDDVLDRTQRLINLSEYEMSDRYDLYTPSYAKGGEVSRSDMEEWFYDHDNEWQNDLEIDHQEEDTNLDLVEWAYNRYHYAKGGSTYAEGGEVSYYDIYDDATNKTFQIKANSLEQAEGIADTIDWDEYKDGERIDVLDDIANYESEQNYAKGGEVSKYKTGITKYGKNQYAVRVDIGDKELIPKLLNDRWDSKAEAEAFAKRLAKRNNGTYVGEDGLFAKGGKVEKKENNEMLIGGIAGVLLGIFLNK